MKHPRRIKSRHRGPAKFWFVKGKMQWIGLTPKQLKMVRMMVLVSFWYRDIHEIVYKRKFTIEDYRQLYPK